MQEANEKEMKGIFSYCHSRYPFGLYSFSE